jgi:hypothetical protein
MARPASEKLRALVVVLGCCVPLLCAATPARAETEESRRDEAKTLFTRGSSAFLAKRYADALEDLRASYKLVPSPNSGLLIARCLKELNRRVDAVEMYATVATDARRRAADGDVKYAQTADVATAEGAAVRATLGTVRVRVAHPPPGALVDVDGTSTPATDTEIVLLRPPGEVTVRFKPKTGAEQSQRATLAAGSELRMEFTPAPADVAPAPPPTPETPHPPPPPPRETEPPAWTVPAAIATGGVALLGMGLFIGFGSQSESIYDELEARCGPAACGPEDRARADEGKRDQTIANVGLAVGIVGAASTVAILLVRLYATPGPAPAQARTHSWLQAHPHAQPSRFVVTAGGLRVTF